MAEIVVVRHGETEWSRTGKHTGRSDVPLTAAGERQATALAKTLADRQFRLVLTSPLLRARRTAELAGFSAATPDADLVEWDYGQYDGQTTAQISDRLGRAWRVWTDGVVDGETVTEVAARAERVIARAEPVLDAGHDVLMFGHGHQLRVLATSWLGLAPADGALFALAAGGIGILGHEHGRRVLQGWNTSCLPGQHADGGPG